ncbi:MAG: hypothetical protein IT405_02230 [Candidatus Yanofskybacteria bacterium]|nr:hypothetical protein [Candidatus Yanofskybacteria bacterium]
MEHEWQLPPTVDRMEVNAALTVLTERFDADAARLVIRAFCDMPVSASSFDEFRDSKRTNRTITGETPEFGSVGIRETVDESRWEGGAEHVARVGQFKVYPCPTRRTRLLHSGVTGKAVSRPRSTSFRSSNSHSALLTNSRLLSRASFGAPSLPPSWCD